MKKKKTGFLIVISGPSGVGKDTICNELVKRSREINHMLHFYNKSPLLLIYYT